MSFFIPTQRRLKKIDLIDLIELINRIALIDTITTIGEIQSILSLPNRNITEYAITHAEDDTEVENHSGTYVLEKTFVIHALNKRKITDFHFEAYMTALDSFPYGFKVTKEVDEGSETTVFEKTTGLTTSYTWFQESHEITGNLITIRLYMKSGDFPDTSIYSRGFKILGETLKELEQDA